jgi:hypothetical protein
MISDHLSTEQIRQLAQTSEPLSDEERSANLHLAECAICSTAFRAALNAAPQDIAMLDEAPEDDCPVEEVWVAYVQGRLAETDPFAVEILETHLEYCLACQLDVGTLREIHAELQQEPVPDPSRLREAPAITRPAEPGPDWWRSFLSLLRPAPARWTLAGAGAAMAAVFAWTAGIYPLLNEVAVLRSDVRTARTKQQEWADKYAVQQSGAHRLSQQLLVLRSQYRDATAKPTMPARTSIHAHELSGVDFGTYAGATGSDKGDPVPFALLDPLPGQSVRARGLVLHWNPCTYVGDDGKLADCKSYFASIEPVGGGESVSSGFVTSTFWSLKKPLADGTVYTWRVAAFKGANGQERMAQSPRTPVSFRFRTLSKADLKEIDAPRSTSLSRGAIYAKVGLLAESEVLLNEAVKEAPKDAEARFWQRSAVARHVRWLKGAANQLNALPKSRGAQDMRQQVLAQIERLQAAQVAERGSN